MQSKRPGCLLVLQSDVRVRMAEARFSEEKAKMQQKLEQTVRKVRMYICMYVHMCQPSSSCSPGMHTVLLTRFPLSALGQKEQ